MELSDTYRDTLENLGISEKALEELNKRTEATKKINYRDSSDKDLVTLRKLRDELSDKSSKVQRLIDKIILEKNDFDKYVGKFLLIKKGKDKDSESYIYVKEVKRLFSGAKLLGTGFYFTDDTHLDLDLEMEEYLDMTYDIKPEIKIISKEDFMHNFYCSCQFIEEHLLS